MIHPNDVPDAPEWTVSPATCRRCHDAWHADSCPVLEVPANITLGGAGD